MPADLLSLAPDECIGFIVPVRSQLRRFFTITRHGWILDFAALPDIGLQLRTEGSHRPVLCLWRLVGPGSGERGARRAWRSLGWYGRKLHVQPRLPAKDPNAMQVREAGR